MRKAREFVTLPSGKRVGYRVALRPFQPFLFVYFRGPDGRRHERSTGERRKVPARNRAWAIIEEEYLRGLLARLPTSVRELVEAGTGHEDQLIQATSELLNEDKITVEEMDWVLDSQISSEQELPLGQEQQPGTSTL
jgi:hypothetical protein